MGHLSTSERVCSKTPIPSSGEGSPPLLARRSKLSGDSNQGRRGEDSSPELPPRGKLPLPKSLSSMKSAVSAVPEDLVDHVPKDQIDLEVYTRNFQGDKVLGYQFQAPLKWDKVIQISLLHIVAVVCLLTYPLRDLNPYTTLWSFFVGGVAGFGVTAGAHRFWTHRSYTANTVLRSILMICYCVAGQNTLYDWVRDHRVHHKYSETDADPHNANRGFFFSHVGWLMMLKHPDVLRRGRQIDMSDVLADPVVRFHQKYFIPLKIFLCFILPSAVPVCCWGESWHLALIQQCLFRYVSSLNFTWSVNSAAHLWGSRPYDKRIMPSENIYVSLVAMGEGWHNYHHVFPWDYKAAELGNYGVNFTTMVLDAFHKLGWAWNMKQPSKELVRRTLEKYGDGSHASQMGAGPEGAVAGSSQMVGHFHYAEVPDPELEYDAESSSTESAKLDENENESERQKKGKKVAAT
ncbi:acyl-CoA Delta(11) desaturase isoform X1 [Drosophila miranda]|uniref:acyl-CoA Delta(11) desaturase isoform X1 n=2 Tax=Drosophila miranda TaxID=7229 RepID=UPI0007E84206|nr:acyl-CoA Delta(11) desaturase isoform X1 [Drosophila miranda]